MKQLSTMSDTGPRNGSARHECSRSAIARAPSSPTLRQSRTNSSPPERANVSPGRSTRDRRPATSVSTRSPVRRPKPSLTTSSRFTHRHRTAAPAPRCDGRSASSSRSRKRTELGSPVCGSCVAWWISSASCPARRSSIELKPRASETISAVPSSSTRMSSCSRVARSTARVNARRGLATRRLRAQPAAARTSSAIRATIACRASAPRAWASTVDCGTPAYTRNGVPGTSAAPNTRRDPSSASPSPAVFVKPKRAPAGCPLPACDDAYTVREARSTTVNPGCLEPPTFAASAGPVSGRCSNVATTPAGRPPLFTGAVTTTAGS